MNSLRDLRRAHTDPKGQEIETLHNGFTKPSSILSKRKVQITPLEHKPICPFTLFVLPCLFNHYAKDSTEGKRSDGRSL